MGSDVRHVPKADVYKNGVLAATLERDATGHVHFAYVSGYRGPQVASTLPVLSQDSSVVGVGLPPFFAGLLPEGYRLDLLREHVKTSPDDELSLLLAVGSDLPGDVQVVPHGQAIPEPVTHVDGEPLSEMNFADFFDVVDIAGIPGVQAKISSAMLSIPLSAGSGGYILKLSPPRYELLVENEAHHLDVARSLKIPVAPSRLVVDKKNQSGLLVERFDRGCGEDGSVRRFAVEDAGQVLGILPSRKYLVSTEEVAGALVGQTSAKPVAARNLLLQFVFAWLTGNGDLHAKNVSILERQPGRWEVSPIYDIPCTAVFRDFDMALPIAGRTKDIRARHWREFIDTLHIPIKAARAAVEHAVTVAAGADLAHVGYSGSPLHGAQREISLRRQEAVRLIDAL